LLLSFLHILDALRSHKTQKNILYPFSLVFGFTLIIAQKGPKHEADNNM